MAAILRVVVLGLLMHGCLCSVGQTYKGCKMWNAKAEHPNDVCCEECHPGNVLVQECGPRASSLCKPCENGKYTVSLKSRKCLRCTQCVGALVTVKACTPMSDTVCGCKEGLTCGDPHCSFCVTKCGKGEEPTAARLCRPCPEGTFNDQEQQKCKPKSTKCPSPDQRIVDMGDASNDITCANVSAVPSHKPNQPGTTKQEWPLVLSVVISMTLVCFIIAVAVKILQQRKRQPRPKKTVTKTPVIRMPTDDPRTLIAMECSFHEAQQEQGSSTESLDSKDSSGQLIA